MELPTGKVICHIDLDAFYAQVEVQRDKPRLEGKPVCVVQYNPSGNIPSLAADDDRVLQTAPNSIIALSYEARARGLKRSMRADEALKVCPEAVLIQVPTANGKSDLTLYREAGARVLEVLGSLPNVVCERASIDEVYLDLTAATQQVLEGGLPVDARVQEQGDGASRGVASGLDADDLESSQTSLSSPGSPSCPPPASQSSLLRWEPGMPPPPTVIATHIGGIADEARDAEQPSSFETAGRPAAPRLGAVSSASLLWWTRDPFEWAPGEAQLAAGAIACAHVRARVLSRLGFTCSAGLAHSKLLAKLGSGLHKPDQQTLVPASHVSALLAPVPLQRLRGLGGKFGSAVAEAFQATTVSDLAAVPLPALRRRFGDEAATRLHGLARGVDGAELNERRLPLSQMCAKSYPGNKALRAPREVGAAFQPLSLEMQRRLEADRDANGRVPRLFVAVWGGKGAAGERLHASRSAPMRGWMDAAAMQQLATALFEKWARHQAAGWCIEVLDMGAAKFEAVDRATSDITALFKQYKKQEDDGAGSEEQEDQPDGAEDGPGGRDARGSKAADSERGSVSSSASVPAEQASRPSLEGAPPGTDLETWVALPPAVRREIKEQAKMEAMLRGSGRSAKLPAGKAAAASKRPSGSIKEGLRTMQSFFERHKKPKVDEEKRGC